jgi:putative hydrolase of the HAD superfamily
VQPLRNVIFDFGGVLLRWEPREVVERLFDATVHDRVMQASFQHADWLEVDRGTLDEALTAARVAERTGLPQESIAVLLQRARESLSPFPDSINLLRDLAGRGVRLFGLSNMHGDTFRYLQGRFDFWELFEGIVISGDIGLLKPGRPIFDHLTARFGLEPPETAFIDDTLPNVLTARDLGLRAIHFTDAAECAAELYPMLAPVHP